MSFGHPRFFLGSRILIPFFGDVSDTIHISKKFSLLHASPIVHSTASIEEKNLHSALTNILQFILFPFLSQSVVRAKNEKRRPYF